MKTMRVIMMSVCVMLCLGWSLSVMAAKYDPLVENAQKRLAELGYEVGTPDGKVGTKTIEAIKKFQQDQGLTVTGKLDEETLEKLGLVDQKQLTDDSIESPKNSGASESQSILQKATDNPFEVKMVKKGDQITCEFGIKNELEINSEMLNFTMNFKVSDKKGKFLFSVEKKTDYYEATYKRGKDVIGMSWISKTDCQKLTDMAYIKEQDNFFIWHIAAYRIDLNVFGFTARKLENDVATIQFETTTDKERNEVITVKNTELITGEWYREIDSISGYVYTKGKEELVNKN